MSEDAIVIINRNGCIVLVNAQTEEMFGYCCDDLIGKPIEVLLPDCFWEPPTEVCVGHDCDHAAGAVSAVADLVAQRKNGSQFTADLHFSPLNGDDGIFIMSIIRDAAKRKNAGEEHAQLIYEQAARVEAEAANRAKDEFLAMVSHELRAPLSAVLGWARLLRAGKLDARSAAHAIEIIEHNARLQAQLIEDLMDISRIVAGKLQLEFRAVDLATVIGAAVDALAPSAETKAIRLQQVLDPAAGLILGDSHRLEQVVWNLLSNAVKFTPRGGLIEVRLERHEADTKIVVRDTGQGIRASFLPYVFERFRQDDSSSALRHQGLGLGLAIVRHLVEMHGGTVSAESSGEGQGATFVITLPPLKVAAEPVAAYEQLIINR